MTTRRKQAGAVVFSVLMIVSMVAGSVAFGGLAAADGSDVTPGDNAGTGQLFDTETTSEQNATAGSNETTTETESTANGTDDSDTENETATGTDANDTDSTDVNGIDLTDGNGTDSTETGESVRGNETASESGEHDGNTSADDSELVNETVDGSTSSTGDGSVDTNATDTEGETDENGSVNDSADASDSDGQSLSATTTTADEGTGGGSMADLEISISHNPGSATVSSPTGDGRAYADQLDIFVDTDDPVDFGGQGDLHLRVVDPVTGDAVTYTPTSDARTVPLDEMYRLGIQNDGTGEPREEILPFPQSDSNLSFENINATVEGDASIYTNETFNEYVIELVDDEGNVIDSTDRRLVGMGYRASFEQNGETARVTRDPAVDPNWTVKFALVGDNSSIPPSEQVIDTVEVNHTKTDEYFEIPLEELGADPGEYSWTLTIVNQSRAELDRERIVRISGDPELGTGVTISDASGPTQPNISVNETASFVSPTAVASGERETFDVTVRIDNTSFGDTASGNVTVAFEGFNLSTDDDELVGPEEDLRIDYTDANVSNGTLSVTDTVTGTAPSIAGSYPVNVTDVEVATGSDTDEFLLEDANVIIETVDVNGGAGDDGDNSTQVDVDPDELPGSGTESDPYQIANASELQAMEGDLDANYTLVADIDASNTAQWNNGRGFAPIGDDPFNDSTSPAFTGSFDGDNHTITGLTIDRPDAKYVGLFGYADSARISAISVTNLTAIGEFQIGGIAGLNAGLIQHATVSGSVNGSGAVGGVAGRNSGTIRETVTSSNVTGTEFVGGVVGVNYDTIQNVATSGDVRGSKKVGGLAGSSPIGTIRETLAVGSVTGDSEVGGLVGAQTVVVDESYWDIDATGQRTSGGSATGLTTAEMQGPTALSSMRGLDFENTWTTTRSYPALRAFYEADDGDSESPPADLDSNDLVGAGTETDPYEIPNVSALQAIEDDPDANYTLVTDIDASNTSRWNNRHGFDPIGDAHADATTFTGSLDGNNHTISGLTINRPDESQAGIFGVVDSATVTDLSVTDLTVVGGSEVGGLAGRNGGTIRNTTMSGTVIGSVRVGGLVGVAIDDSTVRNAAVSGEVTGSDQVGGLVGESNGTVEDSTASITVTGEYDLGGLVGINNGAIRHVMASGSVTGEDDLGGLVGTNDDTVENATASVSLSGRYTVGGLIGNNNGIIRRSAASGDVNGSEFVGGLVGGNRGSIRNARASGTVSGAENVGGLAGITIGEGSLTEGTAGTLQNVTASGDVTGTAIVGGLIGTAQRSNTILEATASGNVTGRLRVAGLVGMNTAGSTIQYATASGDVRGGEIVGGLVGDNDGGEVRDSFAVGSVAGGNAGGLTGLNSGTVADSYWDVEETGQSASAGNASGLTTVEMQGEAAQTNMSGLDFETTWRVTDGYPALRAFSETAPDDGEDESPDQPETQEAAFRLPAQATASSTLHTSLGGETDPAVAATNVTSNVDGAIVVVYEVSRGADRIAGVKETTATETNGDPVTIPLENTTGLPGPHYAVFLNESTVNSTNPSPGDILSIQAEEEALATRPSLESGSFYQTIYEGEINVTDQQFSGSTTEVTINQSALQPDAPSGYAVVLHDQSSAPVGAPIGASQVLNGTHTNFSVTLDEEVAINTTQEVTAMLHVAANGSPGRAIPNADVDNGFVAGNIADRATITIAPSDDSRESDVDTSNLAGNGTDNEPYEISNASELQAIEDDLDANYTLVNDIDASATAAWNDGSGFDPIGADPSDGDTPGAFTGSFVGNGYTVTGLSINRSSEDDVGLFGSVSDTGTVRGVSLTDVNVTGSDSVGGLIGLSNGATVVSSSVAGTVTGSDDVGILVGQNADGTIELSRTTGTVTGSGFGIGGLVGNNDGAVDTSYSSGAVTGSDFVGGLVGSNAGTVNSSYAAGPVTAESALVGGLVGSNDLGTVTGSYWNTEATNQSASDGGTGLTTEEMTGQAAVGNMTGFEFGTNWEIRPNDYPRLKDRSDDSADGEDRLAPFSRTVSLNPNQTNSPSLAGKFHVEQSVARDTNVTLLQNSSTEYSMNITAPDGSENVTFYLQERAISASQNIDDVRMLLDGQPRQFTVVEDAGPGGSPWIAFTVPHFSTRTVTFTSESGSEGAAPSITAPGNATYDPSSPLTIETSHNATGVIDDSDVAIRMVNSTAGNNTQVALNDSVPVEGRVNTTIPADSLAGNVTIETQLYNLSSEADVASDTVSLTVETGDDGTNGGGGTDGDDGGGTDGGDNETGTPSFVVSDLDPQNVTVTAGDTLTVTATIKNVGDANGTQSVEYRIDGTVMANETITSAPGETTTVEFADIETTNLVADSYDHGVFTENASQTGTLTVDAETDGGTDDSTPGFGHVVSLLALMLFVFGVRRRSD